MEVPFFVPDIDNKEINSVTKQLKSGWLTTGDVRFNFENEFSKYIGSKYSVAVSSCTAALHLACHISNIKRNDYIAVPTMTFAATAEVISYFGAKPVLIDCNKNDLNICKEDLNNKLTTYLNNGIKIKAVIVVHFAGIMCDMFDIVKLQNKYKFKIIEDSAHCNPSTIKHNKKSSPKNPGYFSNLGCFSFYANKNITTGEGGMITTSNKNIYNKLRKLSLHGISKNAWNRFKYKNSWEYDIEEIGYKYNLTDIASSIGLIQLKKANKNHKKRINIANIYKKELCEIKYIELPSVDTLKTSSYHLYIIKLINAKISRNELIYKLSQKGIIANVHYKPLHLHSIYRKLYGNLNKELPNATETFDLIISLPIYPNLSIEKVKYICDTIKKLLL